MFLLTCLFGLLSSFQASAEQPADPFREGIHYQILSTPVPVENKGKIEVNTIFWYQCGFCLQLVKQEQQWKQTLAPDVALLETPVVFGGTSIMYARLFYSLRYLKLPEKINLAVFNAIQNERKSLATKREMSDFLHTRFNIDEKSFASAFDEFSVINQTRKAAALTKSLKLTGVPAVVINGTYLVEPAKAGSLEKVLKISEYLINRIRQEKQAEAPSSSGKVK